MHFNLQRTSGTPLYRQIVEQIRDGIESGGLTPGTRLPTVRQLAQELGLTRLTVHSAYTELQSLGFIESFVGRGTFTTVPPHATTAAASAPTAPSQRAPLAASDLPRPPDVARPQRRLAELMRLTEQPALLSFAQAIPSNETFPTKEFRASLDTALRVSGALGYGPIQGEGALRQQVSALLETRGVRAAADDILIDGGAQQGIYLALRAFSRPQDTVVVEEPTYSGAIELAAQRGQRLVGVPVDRDGIDVGALERACEIHRPRLLYTVSTFHNPTGVSLGAQRRAALLALAHKWDFLIVEDDVYGWLAYDGAAPPALKADDSFGRVIYLASFSKVLCPALRLGAIVAAPPLLFELAAVKESCDLVSSTLLQLALADFLERGCFGPHLENAIALYRARRDAMMDALKKRLPKCDATMPGGGFSTWISLPPGINERDFFVEAVDNGVGVARGSAFFHQPRPEAYVRLSFAAQPVDRIAEGVGRLGRLLRTQLEQRAAAAWRANREASPLV